jgi:hypothetical protein
MRFRACCPVRIVLGEPARKISPRAGEARPPRRPAETAAIDARVIGKHDCAIRLNMARLHIDMIARAGSLRRTHLRCGFIGPQVARTKSKEKLQLALGVAMKCVFGGCVIRKRAAEIMSISELRGEQRRQIVDTQQVFGIWRAAFRDSSRF